MPSYGHFGFGVAPSTFRGHRRKERVRNNIEEKEEKREEDKVGKETKAFQAPCGSETYGYSGENSR